MKVFAAITVILICLLSGVNSLAAVFDGQSMSIGSSIGKVNKNSTGALTTTAVTANQSILSYTVTTGKTFYIVAIEIESRLTTLSATASILGTASLQIGGTTQMTFNFTNKTIEEVDRIWIPMNEPLPVSSGTAIAFVCTPGTTTSTLWQANLIGYEK